MKRTVEQLVDAAPCLPALDAAVPLVVEQLVTVLAEMEREEDAEMNRLEDRTLQGAPVSAAEKAAWRRWASRGGESSSRRRKKRKKKKLPRGVHKTGRLHRSKGVADVHAATSSSSALTWRCPRFSPLIEFLLAVVQQRRVPTAQTLRSRPPRFSRCSLWTTLCPCRCCGRDSAARGDPTGAVFGQG